MIPQSLALGGQWNGENANFAGLVTTLGTTSNYQPTIASNAVRTLNYSGAQLTSSNQEKR